MNDELGHEYIDHLIEVVSSKDIARRLGVKLRTVYQWRQRGLIPEPDFKADPPLWRWTTVEAWARETSRL